MAICPQGHESSDEEYCDTCGTRMSGTPAGGVPLTPESPRSPSPTAAGAAGGGGCPDCGAPRGGRFCENCGYDFVLGAGAAGQAPSPAVRSAQPPSASSSWRPAQPRQARETPSPRRPAPVSGATPSSDPAPAGGWFVVVSADRAHYESMIAQGGPDAATVAFPPYCPERRLPLGGPEMRIGRRRQSRPMVPEIDLSEPPEDPGVSHLHAVLLAQPDGTWQIVDPGSANGTFLNGEPLEINVPIPLTDGDRVHVGAWTLVTVRKG